MVRGGTLGRGVERTTKDQYWWQTGSRDQSAFRHTRRGTMSDVRNCKPSRVPEDRRYCRSHGWSRRRFGRAPGGVWRRRGNHDHRRAGGRYHHSAGGATTHGGGRAPPRSAPVPRSGREIKLGFVTPQTGPLASFGIADKYCVDHFKEISRRRAWCSATARSTPSPSLLEDSQSNSNRSAQVAGDLILNSKVDIIDGGLER